MRTKTFEIIVPIHDAIMIECDDEETAQNVGQLMKIRQMNCLMVSLHT